MKATDKGPKVQDELCDLDALSLARLMSEGQVTAEAVTESHLARIEARDGELHAFAHIDADYARHQAKALDRHRKYGRPLGPLHGVPVAVKDIVDVRGLPCENGTEIDSGRRPSSDAFCVTKLREAGAVILGKATTTELALFHPSPARNPHDPSRTPGGSSAGSAAAVAANLVPLAIGSQTNGSVVRPASYCGVVGFKPSRGMISRHGALVQSPSFDTIGVMGRSVEDAAAFADTMLGYDERDPAMQPQAHPRLLEAALGEPPVPPKLAFVAGPSWSETDEDLRSGFEELVAELGDRVGQASLPKTFLHGHAMHRAIHTADAARHLARYEKKGSDKLSETVRGFMEEGRKVTAVDYIVAQDGIALLNDALEELFNHYSAILTPAASGEAPGVENTGSPSFCTLWTYCGVPAITLPLLVGANGLPIGVQLVGRRGEDGRLLRTARWLVERLRLDDSAATRAAE